MTAPPIYGRVAHRYTDAGWRGVLPLPPGQKFPPPTGFTGVEPNWPTAERVERWAAEQPDANVALRLPADVVGLDVDAYDGREGGTTLDRLVAELGELPRTWTTTSRSDGRSGIRLYRCHPTDSFPTGGGGIDVVRFGHRYCVVPPSVHPSGQPYRWISPDGEVVRDRAPRPDELPWLPPAWREGLTDALRPPPPPQPPPAARPATPARRPTPGRSRAVDERMAQARADLALTGSRHDRTCAHVMALLRLDEREHPGADAALDELSAAFVSTVSGDGSRTLVDAEAEFRGMVDYGRPKLGHQAPSTPRYGDAVADAARRPTGKLTVVTADDNGPAVVPADDRLAPVVLPPEFWSARPVLDHIRRAALARLISPDAVLGCVLARAVAMTHHAITLPPIVGRRVGLELFVAIAARPGAGKGSAMDCARELIPPPGALGGRGIAGRFTEAPVGSGEGIVKLAFEVVTEQGDDGKVRKVQRQHCWNLLLRVDEAETLSRLAQRRDQTTMTVLRSAWSREQLGAAYSDETKDRRLPPGSYRLGLVMGVQPELARALFDDAHAGTPQRFSWLSGTHPLDLDLDVAWPGTIKWSPPPNLFPADDDLDVAPAIADELRAAHLCAVRGEANADTHDAHAGLRRLKLGAALAMLDGRRNVSDDDWHLAGVLADTSNRVRDRIRAQLADEDRARGEQEARRAARRRTAELGAEEDHHDRRVANAAARLARKVAGADEALPWRALRDTLGSRLRDVRDDARDYAVAEGWIVETEDGRWAPGQHTSKVAS